MAQVEFDLKFKASNTKSIDDVEKQIDKLDKKLSKKFEIGLDSKDFVKNLESIQSSLKRLGLDNQLAKNIESIAKSINDVGKSKIDVEKLKAFVDTIKGLSAKDIKEIAGSLNSLGNALIKMNGLKVPSLANITKAVEKISMTNIDLGKIDKLLLTLDAFKSISMNISGTSDLVSLIKALNSLGKSSIDDSLVSKIQKLGNAMNALKVNVKATGLENINEFIKNIKKLDKLPLDEQKFLKKMETVKKGFEQLSQAKVDIQKIKAMAETMREISTVVKEASKTSGLDTGTIAGMLGGFISVHSIGSMVQDAKELEYAILQVGVAGELTRTQMDMLKDEIYDFSRATGKSALEITQALDSIIKTGQTVEDSRKILEGAVRASVSSGEPLLNTADALSKMLLTMGISADKTIEVLDMFQSVMNKTPASMRSLQEGLKQSGAGFANYATTTSKSGKSLEDYKMKILETEMAMLGSQAKMGRLGEQSGTTLRALATKITTME